MQTAKQIADEMVTVAQQDQGKAMYEYYGWRFCADYIGNGVFEYWVEYNGEWLDSGLTTNLNELENALAEMLGKWGDYA